MSKRFSFGIGKRASGQERPNTNDETASVQSESESVISTESWALSDKNQFMSRIARLGGINDRCCCTFIVVLFFQFISFLCLIIFSISLDEMLKNLYQDPVSSESVITHALCLSITYLTYWELIA